MYDKFCLICFKVFHFLAYAVLVLLWPVIIFFGVISAFECTIIKALIITFVFVLILALIIFIIHSVSYGYDVYQEKEFEKRHNNNK